MSPFSEDRSREAAGQCTVNSTLANIDKIACASAGSVNPFLDNFLQYAGRGWHVFPAVYGDRVGHKSAEFSNGRKWGMTTDADEIHADARRWPNAGIGIAMGEISGTFVLDVDTPDGHSVDGAASLAELEERHGALPLTLQAATPSGGVHHYFNHPGFKVKNSVSEIAPGLDIRGDGGMVLAAPTVMPGKPGKPGGCYRWLNDLPLADAPQWLLDRIVADKERPDADPEIKSEGASPYKFTSDSTTASRRRYALKVLENKCAELSTMRPESGRNGELNTSALLLAKLVAVRALSTGEVRSGLFNASVANLLVRDTSRTRVWATIESGYSLGIKEPWVFPDNFDDGYQEEPPRQRDAPADARAAPNGGPWPYTMAKDFRTDFTRNWIIKNVIALGEVSNWCAPPKTGKSALVGDLSLHVTAGRDWRGYKSKQQGAVVYFALERADLVRRRFNAQCAEYGIDPKTLHFAVIGVTIDMMRQYCVDKFVATIRAIEAECGMSVLMIVVDTSAKAIAAGGGEENSAKDKNIMRANARRVIEIIEGLHVALVSHTGKDLDKGERGSNAGLGDDDMLVMLTRQAATVAARNDGPEGVLTNYGIMSVVVGTDDDGEAIDISIIDPDTTAKAASPKTKPKGQPGMALDFLVETINEVGILPPGSLELPKSVIKVVKIEQWKERCHKRRFAGGDQGHDSAFRKAFDRAVDKLQELHLIAILSDYAWILYE